MAMVVPQGQMSPIFVFALVNFQDLILLLVLQEDVVKIDISIRSLLDHVNEENLLHGQLTRYSFEVHGCLEGFIGRELLDRTPQIPDTEKQPYSLKDRRRPGQPLREDFWITRDEFAGEIGNLSHVCDLDCTLLFYDVLQDLNLLESIRSDRNCPLAVPCCDQSVPSDLVEGLLCHLPGRLIPFSQLLEGLHCLPCCFPGRAFVHDVFSVSHTNLLQNGSFFCMQALQGIECRFITLGVLLHDVLLATKD
mmetsp:Transcript_100291/g.223883  ORF Transcript_100291/g.223883 Transcript_100291/m.223883 type:complete len:250 (-) Transcript_100291:187-936(-)